MHARTGQNLYGPLTIVRRAIKTLSLNYSLWIALAVSMRELFHEPIDLLRFPWQPETTEKCANGGHELKALHVDLVHVGVHHFFV